MWKQSTMCDDKGNILCIYTSFCEYICYAGLKMLKTARLERKWTCKHS